MSVQTPRKRRAAMRGEDLIEDVWWMARSGTTGAMIAQRLGYAEWEYVRGALRRFQKKNPDRVQEVERLLWIVEMNQERIPW